MLLVLWVTGAVCPHLQAEGGMRHELPGPRSSLSTASSPCRSHVTPAHCPRTACLSQLRRGSLQVRSPLPALLGCSPTGCSLGAQGPRERGTGHRHGHGAPEGPLRYSLPAPHQSISETRDWLFVPRAGPGCWAGRAAGGRRGWGAAWAGWRHLRDGRGRSITTGGGEPASTEAGRMRAQRFPWGGRLQTSPRGWHHPTGWLLNQALVPWRSRRGRLSRGAWGPG